MSAHHQPPPLDLDAVARFIARKAQASDLIETGDVLGIAGSLIAELRAQRAENEQFKTALSQSDDDPTRVAFRMWWIEMTEHAATKKELVAQRAAVAALTAERDAAVVERDALRDEVRRAMAMYERQLRETEQRAARVKALEENRP